MKFLSFLVPVKDDFLLTQIRPPLVNRDIQLVKKVEVIFAGNCSVFFNGILFALQNTLAMYFSAVGIDSTRIHNSLCKIFRTSSSDIPTTSTTLFRFTRKSFNRIHALFRWFPV